MNGEKNLDVLLSTMKPVLNDGDYVFCSVQNPGMVNGAEVIMSFRESEGTTLVMEKRVADDRLLAYSFVASWITLTVHSSLEAVGLTAAFATALAAENISCNVVAGYFHDHIFVEKREAPKAMEVLERLSSRGQPQA